MERREKCKKGKGKRRVKRKKEKEKMETARENRKRENRTWTLCKDLRIICRFFACLKPDS